MRNLKKHLEKIYRKVAFKLVQQDSKAELNSKENAPSDESPVSVPSISEDIPDAAPQEPQIQGR